MGTCPRICIWTFHITFHIWTFHITMKSFNTFCMLFYFHMLQQSVSLPYIYIVYNPFTQGMRPLCLPCTTTKLARSPLKAQRRPKVCHGHSRMAQRTFRPRHGCHGRCEVLSMFKTVTQRSPRRLVAHRSLKGGRGKARVSLWLQNGCTGVGHWSPHEKCILV